MTTQDGGDTRKPERDTERGEKHLESATAEMEDADRETLPTQKRTNTEAEHVEVWVGLLPDIERTTKHFRVRRDVPLLDVLDEGAEKLEVRLLPDSRSPLDQLRGVYAHSKVGEPLNLKLALAEFLRQPDRTDRFAVELVLAIQINTRWRVAPREYMDPRAILELAGLSPTEYSLYFPPDSVDPLPPDKPVKLERGMRFEAQRDGKYGGDELA